MKKFTIIALVLPSLLFAQANKKPAAKPAPAAPSVAAPSPDVAPAAAATEQQATPVLFKGKVIYAAGIVRPNTLTYRFNYKPTVTAAASIPVEIERNATDGGVAVGYSVFGMLAGPVYWGLDQTAQFYALLSTTTKLKTPSTGAESTAATYSQNTVGYSINPILGYRVSDSIGIFAGGGVGALYQLAAERSGVKLDPTLDALYVVGYAIGGVHWLAGPVMISPQFRYDFYLGGVYNGAASTTQYSTGGNIANLIKAGSIFEIRLAVGYNFAQ